MSFADDLRKFAEKTKRNTDQVVRETVLTMGRNIILASPVGNPELWAINSIAAQYNTEVARTNAELRLNPENLTKNGRLKKGKKIHDSMEIKAPDGYVGGRFRANWHITFDAPDRATYETVDPSGAGTIAEITAAMTDFEAGQVAYFINNLPYSIPLEYGHSKQSPSGMVRIETARFQQAVREAVRTIK